MRTATRFDDPTLLLDTLQQLILINTTDVNQTLTQMANLLASTFQSDKSDVFIFQPEEGALVALGTSETPLGRLQQELGLNYLPLSLEAGGRLAEVFLTGVPHLDGHVEQDALELEGVKADLKVRSTLAVPLLVDGKAHGVLVVSSIHPDYYIISDLKFLTVVARWIGEVIHHVNIVEQIRVETEVQTRRATAEEIVSVIAHDFKNLLLPLKLSIEMLYQASHIHDRALLSNAQQAVRYLTALTNTLLDAARLDEGLFALAPDVVEVSALVQQAIEPLRTAEAKIIFHAPEDCFAAVDKIRVQMAVSNLVANALLYAGEQDPVEVKVCLKQNKAGKWVEISVADKGVGIEPAMLPHLFKRFSAGHQSAGLGIGLYVAFQVADAHGGTLTVSSTMGEGTTFYLMLPALAETPPPPA